VLVMAQAGNAKGVLRAEAMVVAGRVTTLSCLPWALAY